MHGSACIKDDDAFSVFCCFTQREYGIYIRNICKESWEVESDWTKGVELRNMEKKERLWWEMVMMFTCMGVRDQTRAGTGCLSQGKQGLTHKVCACFVQSPKWKPHVPFYLGRLYWRLQPISVTQKLKKSALGDTSKSFNLSSATWWNKKKNKPQTINSLLLCN